MEQKPPGIPPGVFVTFGDANSLPWARYVSVPEGATDQAWSWLFSPQAKSTWPRVRLMYCTGVMCMWRVLPQGKKFSVVGSWGQESTGPGSSVSQTGSVASLAQLALALPKSVGGVAEARDFGHVGDA